VKEVELKILNNGRMYITQSVITRGFSVDPDDRVIMESQCNKRTAHEIISSEAGILTEHTMYQI